MWDVNEQAGVKWMLQKLLNQALIPKEPWLKGQNLCNYGERAEGKVQLQNKEKEAEIIENQQ